ncbi:9157_t:CDS:2 [Cetraspora pellucida]|uniref:9157_t:CDS:1 n=1 Tax=Cetraspora pellucida TaxID=1433469 RepID=A0A9N9JBA1_9GLOM|nr:9157_t:CDS:2 [Cetraspora pellucida]
MVQAMHQRTKAGCEDIVHDAISTCPVQANANYITRNYLKNFRQWVLWARQHLSLLLQITSTNSLESFHMCYILLELDNKKMMAAKETAINFRTKRISLANIRPEILTEVHKFPFPFQKLIAEEVHAVTKRLEEGKCLPNLEKAWSRFQRTFEESDIEVYQTCCIVEVPVVQRSPAKKVAEKSQLKMSELFERTQDCYYRLAEKSKDEAS